MTFQGVQGLRWIIALLVPSHFVAVGLLESARISGKAISMRNRSALSDNLRMRR